MSLKGIHRPGGLRMLVASTVASAAVEEGWMTSSDASLSVALAEVVAVALSVSLFLFWSSRMDIERIGNE